MNINYGKAWTQIELTDFCNLSCIMCEQGGKVSWNKKSARVHERKKGFIDRPLFQKILGDFKQLGKFYEISPFWLGEATIHPEFSDLMDDLCSIGHDVFEVVQLHTNLNLLDDKAFESFKNLFGSFNRAKLVISIDAASSETYEKIRLGGDFRKVSVNAKKLIALKKSLNSNVKIVLQFIVMEQNKHEVQDFFNNWGLVFQDMDMTYKPLSTFESHEIHDFSLPIDNYIYYEVLNTHSHEKEKNFNLYTTHVKEVIPELCCSEIDEDKIPIQTDIKIVSLTDEELREIEDLSLIMIKNPDRKIVDKLKLCLEKAYKAENYIKPCASIFYSPYISSNGDLTICCLDSKMDLCHGSLREHSLKELWEGESLNIIRLNHIAQNFESIPRCQICVIRGQRSQNRQDFIYCFEDTVAYLYGLCK